MAKDLTGTKPRISSGSGERSATGGFRNRGKGLVTVSAGFSNTTGGMFTKGGKKSGGGKTTYG